MASDREDVADGLGEAEQVPNDHRGDVVEWEPREARGVEPSRFVDVHEPHGETRCHRGSRDREADVRGQGDLAPAAALGKRAERDAHRLAARCVQGHVWDAEQLREAFAKLPFRVATRENPPQRAQRNRRATGRQARERRGAHRRVGSHVTARRPER